MTWLAEIKKASKSNAGCGLMFAALFVVPGILAITLGDRGIIWGILFLGLAALIAALSAKGMNGQKSIDAFLAEVDSVGSRDSVLGAIDALAPQPGFQAIDVRFHPYFIVYRAGALTHIWRTADVTWMYIQQKNITHKTKAYGITVGKSHSVEFDIEVHCKNQKLFSLPVVSEEEGQRLLKTMAGICPSARIGYQEQTQSNAFHAPRSL
jgi:hypothetical protein